MYLGIDVGGTKVLMGAFTNKGDLKASYKFPTSHNYQQFLSDISTNLSQLEEIEYKAAGIAVPGLIDREHGVGKRFGNLPWENVPIVADLEHLLHCPVVLENDAKAGGLSEALLVQKKYPNILYVAIGTGIGLAYIANGIIDTTFGDRGGNSLMLDHKGKIQSWESFASGHAIVQRFGKKASEITDPHIWKRLAADFSQGIVELIALFDIDAIIIGGGVGSHYDRYGKFLERELRSHETPIMKIPRILQAKRAEEAVMYGGYALAKERYG